MAERAAFHRLPDARRDALIEACARGLAARGAGGISVRTICADAGVSPGLLRHYFAGIDALIAHTYVHVAGTVTAALRAAVVAAGPDPHARLMAYVSASFEPPIATPDLLATWTAFWSLVRRDPEIARLHGEIYADYRADLEALLAEAGVEPARVKLAAIALTALVDGLWLELSLDARAFTPTDARAISDRWLSAWLNLEDTPPEPARVATGRPIP
jgi:AcrR family transcriptional regulator